MTLAAGAALRDRGLDIPRDVSVIVYGDNKELLYLRPRPACVKISHEQQAVAAFNMIQWRMKNPGLPIQHHYVAPEFVTGETIQTI